MIKGQFAKNLHKAVSERGIKQDLQILSLESVAVISLSSLLRIWVSG